MSSHEYLLGSGQSELERLRTQADTVGAAAATAEVLDTAKAEIKAHLDDPHTTVIAPLIVQTWGTKPLEA